ncbi:MAG: GNAT family N-acetyltransferase [Acidobacteria bacterium]|nr:MAG: GNAT family N-acetyltransferase [Acidobacteriota bacterium]
MRLSIALATEADVEAIAVLRTAAADHLTAEYGHGHWSSATSSRGVSGDLKNSAVLIARSGTDIVGTLRLARKKPWAIDPAYFTTVARPLYLTSMAVHPVSQRRGVGHRLLEAAVDTVRNWHGDAIRLDAYDAPAGAGGFYLKCGFCEVGRVTYRNVPLIYFEFLVEGPGASQTFLAL